MPHSLDVIWAYIRKPMNLLKNAWYVDLGIVVSSSNAKPFAFCSWTTNVAIDRLMNSAVELSEGTQLIAAQTHNNGRRWTLHEV